MKSLIERHFKVNFGWVDLSGECIGCLATVHASILVLNIHITIRHNSRQLLLLDLELSSTNKRWHRDRDGSTRQLTWSSLTVSRRFFISYFSEESEQANSQEKHTVPFIAKLPEKKRETTNRSECRPYTTEWVDEDSQSLDIREFLTRPEYS